VVSEEFSLPASEVVSLPVVSPNSDSALLLKREALFRGRLLRAARVIRSQKRKICSVRLSAKLQSRCFEVIAEFQQQLSAQRSYMDESYRSLNCVQLQKA